MSEISLEKDLELRIEDAAIAFAFDHGPLAAAGRGEIAARAKMRETLTRILGNHDLKIVNQ